MTDYINNVNKLAFNIKRNADRVGYTTPKVVNDLLSLYLDGVDEIEKLQAQLQYALYTGGEYLQIETIKN